MAYEFFLVLIGVLSLISILGDTLFWKKDSAIDDWSSVVPFAVAVIFGLTYGWLSFGLGVAVWIFGWVLGSGIRSLLHVGKQKDPS